MDDDGEGALSEADTSDGALCFAGDKPDARVEGRDVGTTVRDARSRGRLVHRLVPRLGRVGAEVQGDAVDGGLGGADVRRDALQEREGRVRTRVAVPVAGEIVEGRDREADVGDLFGDVDDDRAGEGGAQVVDLLRHRACGVHRDGDVGLGDVRSELERRVLLRAARWEDEVEVGQLFELLLRRLVAWIGADGRLGEVAEAVAVGVGARRLRSAHSAPELDLVRDAVVVGVAVDVIREPVAVEVKGEGLGVVVAGFFTVESAVRVGVEVDAVGFAVRVGVGEELVLVEDAVAVRVNVEVIRSAISVGVDAALHGVRDVVAVGVEVGGVRVPVAVDVLAALDLVCDAVRVGVEVAEVGDAVEVGVDRRRDEIGVAGLHAVGDAVIVRVEVLGVELSVAIGVGGAEAFVEVRDRVSVEVGRDEDLARAQGAAAVSGSVFPSSQASPRSTIPLPHPSSFRQSASHPSPGSRLPSSHCSPRSTMAFPQVSSDVQVALHPSPGRRLPSSQTSGSSTVPLPQI